MMRLYVQAFWQLLRFQFYLVRGDFAVLHKKVRECPCDIDESAKDRIGGICRAIDVACVCYPKSVLCLQRSSATACLLRRYGVPAKMVVGVQKLPFNAHAWVEVDGHVVNDKPYTSEMYIVLDRC
jgi:transglutaminase superfamily protein